MYAQLVLKSKAYSFSGYTAKTEFSKLANKTIKKSLVKTGDQVIEVDLRDINFMKDKIFTKYQVSQLE